LRPREFYARQLERRLETSSSWAIRLEERPKRVLRESATTARPPPPRRQSLFPCWLAPASGPRAGACSPPPRRAGRARAALRCARRAAPPRVEAREPARAAPGASARARPEGVPARLLRREASEHGATSRRRRAGQTVPISG